MSGYCGKSGYYLKGLVYTVLMMLLFPAFAFAQKPAGTYKITFLFGRDQQTGLAEPGTTLYLKKLNWHSSEGTTVDSATVNRKMQAVFKGLTYPLDLDKDQERLFTAGEYWLCNSDGSFFSFVYSPMDGRSFKETFEKSPGGQFIRKGYNPKKLKENDLMNPRAFGSRAAAHLAAQKHFPASLYGILSRFEEKPLSANDESQLPDIADERLFYTGFGKSIIDGFLDKFALSKESVRNMAIDYLMENKYLTHPKMKAAVAMECFRYFTSSVVMGCEGSAVYAAEKYIIGNESVPLNDRAEAAYFVTMNKGTLIGSKVPYLQLKDTSGNLVSTNDLMGNWSVIYFYSDDCIHCKIETPKLINFLDGYKDNILNVLTVYTGTDSLAWKQFVEENFSTMNPYVNWYHVSDIGRDSNFAVDFGVASTPKMYLLDQGLRIRGKGILTNTLGRILEDEEVLNKKAYQYLATIFATGETGIGNKELQAGINKALVDKIYEGISSSDESFQRLLRQTFTYLYFSDRYADKEAAAYLGKKYVLQMPQRWDDTVFVSNVGSLLRAYELNRPQSKAENLMLYDISGNPSELLPDDGKVKVLIFYRTSCGVCKEDIPLWKEAWRKYGRKVSFTGVLASEEQFGSWKKFVADNALEFRQLYDKDNIAGLADHYYVETVPKILVISAGNTVLVKDVPSAELDAELNRILKK